MYFILLVALFILIFYGKRIDDLFRRRFSSESAYAIYEDEHCHVLINFHTMKMFTIGDDFSETLIKIEENKIYFKLQSYVSSPECGSRFEVKNGIINYSALDKESKFFSSHVEHLEKRIGWKSGATDFQAFVKTKYSEYLRCPQKSRNFKLEDAWDCIKYKTLPAPI